MSQQTDPNRPLSWRAQYKFTIQSAALAAIVAGSFGVYAALQSGAGVLAALAFGLVALGMVATVWVS